MQFCPHVWTLCSICPLSNNSQFMVKSQYGVFLWHHLHCFGFCSASSLLISCLRWNFLCSLPLGYACAPFALNADRHTWLSSFCHTISVMMTVHDSHVKLIWIFSWCFFLSSLYWWSLVLINLFCVKKIVICLCF